MTEPLQTDESTVAMDGEKRQVTKDGGVTKQILRQGRGSPVPLHARCLVHYTGSLAETGQLFFDSRAESANGEPLQLVAGRDSSLQQVGLNLGVATMLTGERSRFLISPQYGYGEKGNFSFPAVPGNAELIYEVELLDFEPVEEDMAESNMLYEDRLEAAERRRLDGNALFASGNTVGALGKYAMGLSHLSEDLLMQLEGAHLDKANAVRTPILLNIAACHLRLHDWHTAVGCCSQVLSNDPSSAKALFRRGKARHQLQQTEEAEADLQAACKLAPGDNSIAAELQAVRKSLRADKQAQSRMFRGRLKPDPAPAPSTDYRPRSWVAHLVFELLAKMQAFFSSLSSWVSRQ